VTYTVLSSDTLKSIAAGVVALFNANTSLQSLGLATNNITPATLNTSETFSANPTLGASQNNVSVSAIDGGSNTKTNSYQVGLNGAPAQSLTYDLNGNMLSDGTNTYQWDAENRLIQINYPGSGNYSQFLYDGLNACTQINEYSSGSQSSSIQFIWQGSTIAESRSSAGNDKQYFADGQYSSGSVLQYYTRDHLGSVREISNSAGTIVASFSYSPFGLTCALSGTQSADFQYDDYYYHARSGLNYTRFRFYCPLRGDWISRDPIGENDDINLYTFVGNDPINEIDLFGLAKLKKGGGPWAPPSGTSFKCTSVTLCPKMKNNIWIIEKMLMSHIGWDYSMPAPRGGNRHAQEIQELFNALKKCEDQYQKRCNGKNKNKPGGNNATAPASSASSQQSCSAQNNNPITSGVAVPFTSLSPTVPPPVTTPFGFPFLGGGRVFMP
jgi:RHS repeat-associated protein